MMRQSDWISIHHPTTWFFPPLMNVRMAPKQFLDHETKLILTFPRASICWKHSLPFLVRQTFAVSFTKVVPYNMGTLSTPPICSRLFGFSPWLTLNDFFSLRGRAVFDEEWTVNKFKIIRAFDSEQCWKDICRRVMSSCRTQGKLSSFLSCTWFIHKTYVGLLQIWPDTKQWQ